MSGNQKLASAVQAVIPEVYTDVDSGTQEVVFSGAFVPPSRLESLDSNLIGTEPVGVAVLRPCLCRARTCPKCGPRLGWIVRQNALGKARLFRRPAVMTLTADRSHFSGPEDAHTRISAKSYVARLMRLLGIKRWFWVLEFQMATGDGWPHWHILIDRGDLPGDRVDLSKAWAFWRDKWKLGGLDLAIKRSFADREHAVLYITKYLTKMPEAFPVWVLIRKRAIRFVAGCKLMGPLTTWQRRSAKAVPEDPEEWEQFELPFRGERTLLVERMGRYEMMSNVFALDGDCASGVGTWKWIGSIAAVPDDLIDLQAAGLIDAKLAAIDFGDREYLAISEASRGGVVSTIFRIKDQLKDREVGYGQELDDRIGARQWEILDKHALFWLHHPPAGPSPN